MSKCATRIAYGKALAKLVQENERVVVFDADLAGSTKTAEAKKVCPQRHFDMGIAEGNMMDVAAGFAASGKIAFASSFAMFASGRAYEQHDRISASQCQDLCDACRTERRRGRSEPSVQ